MSEMENSQPSSATEKTAKSGNKNSAVITIVLFLLIVAVAAFLWNDVRKLRQQNQAMEALLQKSVESLTQKESAQYAALSSEARERDQNLSSRQESLEQEIQSVRDQLGRSRSEWMTAESDYLLQVANRRLLLERDVRGALIALHSADDLLAEGANPLYLPVREQLHSEIQSLEALTPVDVDGISLELSSLSRQVETLPLAIERHPLPGAQSNAASPAEEKGSVVGRFFAAIWNSIKRMVTVRHLDQKVLPLVPPEQHYFLTENLRLRLEMARIALLRSDAPLYQENLKTAASWLDAYYDHRDATVKRARDEIARLAQINIAPALPEIGASLRTLERIRGKQPGSKPAPKGRQP